MSLSNSALNGIITLHMVKDNMHNKKTRCKDMSINTSKNLVIENRGRTKSKGPKKDDKSKGTS